MMPHIVENHILIPQIAALLKEGRRVEFTPTGNSMRPFIEGGSDTVILQLNTPVKTGDICLVQIMNDFTGTIVYVLHRVISADDENVVLQGDGNLRGLEFCKQGDVLGTVIMIKKSSGRQIRPGNGWLWRKLCRPRGLWLKLYRHIFVYKTMLPLRWKRSR